MTMDYLDIRTIKSLTRKAQRGDEHAFESLAYAFSASLYRVAASCLSSNETDIADLLNLTTDAVHQQLSRGRKRIKCFLDKNERRDRPKDSATYSPIQKTRYDHERR